MMKKIGNEPAQTPSTSKTKQVNPSRELIETLDVVRETALPFPPANLTLEQKLHITRYPQKTADKVTKKFQAEAKHFLPKD